MFTIPNQFTSLQQSTIDSFVRLANVHLETTKRLADLNFATAREYVEEGVRNAQSFSSVKDVQEAVTRQTASAQPVVAKSLAYSRSVYDILAQAGAQLKEIGETQVAEVNKQVAGALDSAAKNAPAGSEPVVAFVKSTVSAATNAVDQAVKVNKQMLAAAEANVANAFATLEKPIANAA